MITFSTALALLLIGYFAYGTLIDRVFGVNETRTTPCYTKQDGVDYTPMASWKVYLIQFLNIAGTGPIFGAIMGILFGPAAYIWIVFGAIFGGAVHDYFSGMISLRKGGISLPELVGDELGRKIRVLMRIMTLILMVMVGAVFVSTPAGLLASMTAHWGLFGTPLFWSLIIFGYYIFATVLPISALIGRIYPIFGIALLIMALGVLYGVIVQEGKLPEFSDLLRNHHPKQLPILPMLFITIACGAVSGFHATQSPLMARCLKHEQLGRPIFYGAMITEGAVALIWAAAAIKFAEALPGEGTAYQKLMTLMSSEGKANPAIVVNAICTNWLGTTGAILAILGVVVAPITSGDTAFRCARLIASDFLNVKQKRIKARFLLSLPIFALAALLMCIHFEVLWRYFAWLNQSLSIFTFWAITVWLARKGKCFYVSLVPALFMTFVCTCYLVVAPEGLQLSATTGYYTGAILTLAPLLLFIYWYNNKRAITR